MADSIEIYRSDNGGLGDSDFSLVATIADGSPFSFTDTPVTPGVLYIYRARRLRELDGVYSSWSNLVYARGPYPLLGAPTTMAETITGAQTLLARGTEITEGQQVKATHLLSYTSHGFTTEMGRAESRALVNSPAEVTDEVTAFSQVTGPVSVDIRPAGYFLRMLLDFYALEVVNDLGAGSGPYEMFFYHRFTEKPGTFIYKAGDTALVFPGAHGNSITIAGDVDRTGADAVMKADMDYRFLNAMAYAAASGANLTALGLDTAAYTLVKPYGPKDWQIRIGGVVSPDARTFNFNVNRNLAPKNISNLKLGPVDWIKPRATKSLTIGLFWENLDILKQFWGQASGASLPFGPTKNLLDTAIQIEFRPADTDGLTPIADDAVGAMDIVFPVVSIQARNSGVDGDGPLAQDITTRIKRDPAINTDHYIRVVTTETQAQMIAASTLIATAPETALYTYNI